MVKYSWILPVRNEAQSLPQLIAEISRVMRSIILSERSESKDLSFEIIAVNDASTDTSLTTLTSLTRPERSRRTTLTPQLRLINFKFQQGKWAALRAGFMKAKGQIIITSDSDLQDDPKEVGKLLNKLAQTPSLQGYDLVSGTRVIRFDPFYKILISKLGNFLISTLTKRAFHDLNSSFKVYRREILDKIPKEGSMLRFSMLFAQKLGYKVAEVPINHRPRLFGKSKFGIVKYLRIIYDLILILLLFSGSGRIRHNE